MKRLFCIAVALLALLAAAARARAAESEIVVPLGLWYEGGVGDARDNVLPADPAAARCPGERGRRLRATPSRIPRVAATTVACAFASELPPIRAWPESED